MVPRSRRDVMRAAAVLSAAAIGVPKAIVAQPSTGSPSGLRFQDDIETGVEISIPFTPYGQDVSLDPHRAVNWGPFWVMLPYAWSGLLRFDENGAVEPDLAASIEPNEDGTIWTATLREGIAYANGDPILAEHFVASWKRALDHTRLSPMASFMEPLEGYTDFVAGASTGLGAVATDETTIEMTLSRPVSHFPSYLATFVWAVVNPSYHDIHTETLPELTDASAGAWKITGFDPLNRIVMSPNEYYWAPPSPSVSSIVWPILTGDGAHQQALDLYTADEAVSADVPMSLLARVQEDETLAQELVEIENHASTLAISMDFHQAPFNDVRVRRAIAMAIDKETWANEIQAGAYVPASAFTPPVLATIANYEAPEAPAFDAGQAVNLLEEAGIDPESIDNDIIYFQPVTDTPEQMESSRQLLAMIEDATGIVITHDTSLTREQITALRQDNGGLQFDLVQWWLDSDTPSLLATVASQASAYNTGWINWEPDLEALGDFDPGTDASNFNELVIRAEAEMDEAARNTVYSEAEALLLNNAVYIPLGYWVQRFIQKPWLRGTRQGPWSGRVPIRIDENVVVIGRPSV